MPLLGIFGNDDGPNPEQVNQHEAAFKKPARTTSSIATTAPGMASYCHRPKYRPEQAIDAWSKVFAFFEKHLAK